MPRRPIPARFQAIAAQLGIDARYFIQAYAIRDDFLDQHRQGKITLSDEERMYLMDRQGVKTKEVKPCK